MLLEVVDYLLALLRLSLIGLRRSTSVSRLYLVKGVQ